MGAELTEVTDELGGCLRKGERVAPEEPLEGYDANTHHGEVDHAQSIFASEKTRVEETVDGECCC